MIEALLCQRSVQRESLRQSEHFFQSLLHVTFGASQYNAAAQKHAYA